MTPIAFCYWLQGYFELQRANEYDELDEDQVKIIKEHLQKVFNNEYPNPPIYTNPYPHTEIRWSSEQSSWVDSNGNTYPNENSKTLDDWNLFYGSC